MNAAVTLKLKALFEQARAAWPTAQLSAAAFAERLLALVEEPTPAALEEVAASEVYLVTACLAGDPGAIRALDQAYLPEIAAPLRRLGDSNAFIADIQQQVRQDFFFAGPDGSSKLAKYSGRGSLRNWVRAVGVRTAATARRGKRRELLVSAGGLARLPAPGGDLELGFLKEHAREHFKAAFAAAIAGLSARERAVLKLHLVEGLNIDRIGTVYSVHRATIARWISAARASLVESTQRELSARMKLSRSELKSLMGAVHSQLDVSLNTFLRASSGPPPG